MTANTHAPHQSDSHDATLSKSDDNLVWIDCEMTGLDPEKERLLEIAVIVTGPNLTPRIEGPVCVHSPKR
jgi:oligoribonuclease